MVFMNPPTEIIINILGFSEKEGGLVNFASSKKPFSERTGNPITDKMDSDLM